MASQNKSKQKHAIGTKLPPLTKLSINSKMDSQKKDTPVIRQFQHYPPAKQVQQRLGGKAPIPSTVSQRTQITHSRTQPHEEPQMSISGSPLSKGEQSDLPTASFNEKRRLKGEPHASKMSLVCELKLKTLRRELNILKQTIPPTDDVVEVLREKAAFDVSLIHTLKKTGITNRWDLMLDFLQDHPQPGIFGLWEYIMQKDVTQLQPRLQETFNVFVNHHFERDLQNLQLNKDRQNRVAKVMLDNMQKAEGYIDSLNLSIWEYQRYTEKISSLVKDNDKKESLPEKELSTSSSQASKHSPSYINLVYHKLETYVKMIEDENSENIDEIETLKIKLYEASAEIEKIQYESKRFQMDNQDKAKQIKALQQEKKQVQQELEAANRKMDEIKNDKQNVNKKFDEMMNVMVKSMAVLRNDVRNDMKQEIAGVKEGIDKNLDEMETRMTARLDEVQDTIDVVQETQDTVREDMSRMEQMMESAKTRKPKDKNVNLKITVKGAVPEEEEFKTRSDILRNIQRK